MGKGTSNKTIFLFHSNTNFTAEKYKKGEMCHINTTVLLNVKKKKIIERPADSRVKVWRFMKDGETEQEGGKEKERSLPTSAVIIRDECIADIDLPCRAEPAR